ncbi:DsrE family protein [Methylotetracoccus oryzae]|uniref:DsrE family protein n=1 Tax=Methylotetracoccus oryzae TaxID=1919059 RepID=UPI00111A0349|nr:DsrE family protein [Methylotetracoccus oryzae]
MMPAAPQFLFVIRTGPGDGSTLAETLDMVFTFAAFDQPVRVLFLDEGVRHLLSTPASACDERAWAMLGALDLYDVREVFVGVESLQARGLSERDCRIAATMLAEDRIPDLMTQHERIQVA